MSVLDSHDSLRNYDDGAFCFQAAQILPNDNLEDETIHRVIGTTMAMLDIYVPAVLSVIYGNETPKDAVQLADRDRSSPDTDESDERSGCE